MSNIREIYRFYERKSVGSIDRVCTRRNFILYVIMVLASNMGKCDEHLNLNLIKDFTYYKFINNISIVGEHCIIDYIDDLGIQNTIEFNIIPDYLSSKFGNFFFDRELKKYQFIGECHNVTFKFLELYPNLGLSAVTSLCESMKNELYFHSYLWNKCSDKVIDFSRNLIMNKSLYDKLFCYKEINVLNYSEIVSSLKYHLYCPYSDKFSQLLYLSLVKLDDKEDFTSAGIGNKRISFFKKCS